MKKTILIIIAILLMTGCSAPVLDGAKAVKADVGFETIEFKGLRATASQNAKDAMMKSNQTGLELFEIIYNKDREINQLFSPISLVYALAMVQNGAVSETRTQILDVLNYENPLDNSDYNEVMNIFKHMEATTTDDRPNAIVKIGNSLWVRENLTPEQPFVDTLKSKYDAEVYKVDFRLTETVDAMNKWVEDHTGGLLKETFKEFDPATVAALINTLYFKGTWRNDFNESLTVEMPFELNNGTKTNVDMMQTQGHFPYLETDSAQILSMSYHGDLRMLIYLPKNDVDDFFKDTEGQAVMLDSENGDLASTKVDVYFLKFDFQANNDLKELLKVMGMELPFEETMADFSELIVVPEGNVYINNIFQNARIIVDEKGTEAAAVTVVEVEAASAIPEPEEIVEFKCDHPFVIVIQDSLTGANLFMGVVNNP
ncbi:MAG: serpin family protein [Clostridiales bacterium]|nr:serpin family protein [Clostridiales bacterium]